MGKYLAILVAVPSVISAADKPPLTLEPSSPWIADFKENSCAIRRSFAGENQQVVLEIDNYGMGDDFDVVVSGVTLKRGHFGAAQARFEPDNDVEELADTLHTSFTDGSRGIIYRDMIFRESDIKARIKQGKEEGYFSPWPSDKRDLREAEITGIFLSGAFEQSLLFKTGALTKPMAIMRQCIDDFAKSKGLDPVTLSTLSRQAYPKDPVQWARRTQEAYPSNLASKGKGGGVRLRLLIDETGKPIDCYIHSRGEDERLDKAACDSAFKYVEFDPALDAAGHPTKVFWSTRITYWAS